MASESFIVNINEKSIEEFLEYQKSAMDEKRGIWLTMIFHFQILSIPISFNHQIAICKA
jgi:endonuclease YncB( thermonuclease family)